MISFTILVRKSVQPHLSERSPGALPACPSQWQCEQTSQSQWWSHTPPEHTNNRQSYSGFEERLMKTKSEPEDYMVEAGRWRGVRGLLRLFQYHLVLLHNAFNQRSTLLNLQKWKYIKTKDSFWNKTQMNFIDFLPSPPSPWWVQSWTCPCQAGPGRPLTEIPLGSRLQCILSMFLMARWLWQL